MSDESSSVLGTKEYWESAYENDLENYQVTNDSGEVWFGKGCQDRIVRWLANRSDIQPNCCRILDLGCGNGALTLALRRNGFKNITGVDYADSAIQLARRVAQQEGVTDLKFQVCDLLAGVNTTLAASFDVLVDKGTYDAVCLMPDGAKGRESYKRSAIRFLSNDSQQKLLIIASCNSTKNELVDFFGPEFVLFDEIIAPNRITFGGSTGTTVTTVVLQLSNIT